MPFIHCHTIRNVAATMTLDHLFSFVHYASSEEIGRTPRRSRFSGISALDPQLLPLFDTPRITWRSFGGGATRLAKTAEVIADERLCGDLCVCIRGFRRDRAAVNCGRCYKCARLLLQAEATGRLDAVAGTVDMEAWRAGRGHAVTRLLWLALGPRRTKNEIDLLAFLDARGFAFPAWARPWVLAAAAPRPAAQPHARHAAAGVRARSARVIPPAGGPRPRGPSAAPACRTGSGRPWPGKPRGGRRSLDRRARTPSAIRALRSSRQT